jgi:hypothetical protein
MPNPKPSQGIGDIKVSGIPSCTACLTAREELQGYTGLKAGWIHSHTVVVSENEPYTSSQYNCNGILQLLLLVFQTQSIIHECSCHQRDWHCPLRFTEVHSKLTVTLSLNLNIQIMFKEYQFSANKAQTLPHAKCIMKVMDLHAICSSMVTPYSSYVQFLTIPWEDI